MKERFFNTNKFSKLSNKKFISLLGKGVYFYEYMDYWEKFNETSPPDVTDADYVQAKRVCKDFEIKRLGECHDLYVQSNTLLLTDVLEKFRNMSFQIYDIDPTRSPGICMVSSFKKD